MKLKTGALLLLSCIARIVYASTPVSIAHSVGSCYGGGVVFYVNTIPGAPPGQQGLIAALTDASESAKYNTNPPAPSVKASATGYFTGLQNSQAIVTLLGASRAQAATAALTYATTTNCPTCTSWYLPSQNELSTLYAQANSYAGLWSNCGGTPPVSNFYWSSSQFDAFTGWLVDFATGNVYVDGTAIPFPVRAVRAF